MTSVACYILGLEARFRGDGLIKDLYEAGIDAQVHFGIDATQNREFLAAKVDQSASLFVQQRELGMTEVACALSHIQIWQKFEERNLEWTFVFEDDAVVVEDLSKIIPSLPEMRGPIIIQLHRSAHNESPIYTRQRINIGGFSNSGKEIHLLKKLSFSYGSYGYVMNRQACQIALKASAGRKIAGVSDWPYLWRHKVAFWEPTVDLVKHQGVSIIATDRAALTSKLNQRPRQKYTIKGRAINILLNLLGIPAWKFHKLGYPARIVYFNTVVLPFKRRLILAETKLFRRQRLVGQNNDQIQ